MKKTITIYLLLCITTVTIGQTRRMENSNQGRTYATKNQSRSVQPLLQQAEQKFRAFDYEGTFLTLESAVAQNPYAPEALIMRARLQRMVGMQREAAVDFRLANRINPMAADLYGYNGTGGLLSLMSIEPEKAVIGLNTFQKLDYYYPILDLKFSEGGNESKTLESLEMVIEEIEANRLDQGLVKVNEILEKTPNSAIAHDLKGVILKKQDKLEEAFESFTKAVQLEPEAAIAWYNIAQVENRLGNFENAKSHLDIAIELDGDLAKAYFERALVFKKMGKQENAIKDYDKIIDIIGETYMEVFLNRGLTKKMLRDYGGALADLDQAIEEFPNNPELLKNRGNLQLFFGLHRKAIDDYTQAIKLKGDYAEAYYNRALAHFILYDKVSGCFDLERSEELGYDKAREVKKYFCTQY